jgi:hypothetical protein
MLIWIAIVNILVWSGIITCLLLILVQSSPKIEAQAARLEARLDESKGSGTHP